MPSLADMQAHLRHTVVTGDASDVLPLLIGGIDVEKRLAIHRRHYETSLVTALAEKFPATEWLIGTPRITEAARSFVHEHPPCAPCIAEYGSAFPEWLSTCAANEGLPYLGAFAELEWDIGQVSVAVDCPAVSVERFTVLDVERLMNTRLTMQPGLRYLAAAWPIDELMQLHLTDTAPARLLFAPADVWIEVHGARGAFQINRLDAGTFAFRRAILEGLSIGEAAECALDAHGSFDPGQALAALVREGLVTAITGSVPEEEP